MRLEPGEQVVVGERDTTWPEFVFVTSDHGEGWVPARHLSAGHGPATVEESYDTTELPTVEGELLEVIRRDDQSGWWWCRSSDGREGWVPINTLEG
jgi:hypothetical protein